MWCFIHFDKWHWVRLCLYQASRKALSHICMFYSRCTAAHGTLSVSDGQQQRQRGRGGKMWVYTSSYVSRKNFCCWNWNRYIYILINWFIALWFILWSWNLEAPVPHSIITFLVFKLDWPLSQDFIFPHDSRLWEQALSHANYFHV